MPRYSYIEVAKPLSHKRTHKVKDIFNHVICRICNNEHFGISLLNVALLGACTVI